MLLVECFQTAAIDDSENRPATSAVAATPSGEGLIERPAIQAAQAGAV
jgi:hypothetical protein